MSVVAADGFSATGVASGIKATGLDVAIVASDRPAMAAGVFTTNQAAAAPVHLSRSRLGASTTARAVVLNSGCANAATGPVGTEHARRTSEVAASALSVDASQVLVCSTGPIGPQLPMDALSAGVREAASTLGSSARSGTLAAMAIMTTDSVPKEGVVRGDGWTIGGMAKGAGMLRPDMATMLAVLTTDAVVDHGELSDALQRAVDGSFNSLNVDGCESTNDTVIVLANGASGVSPPAGRFAEAIASVSRDLAVRMARDAEGASRLVSISVTGATDDAHARGLGRLVADSALVRASFYGGDVNWGRIIGALGTADTVIDFSDVTVAYHGVTVFSHGIGVRYDEADLLASLEDGDLAVSIVVGSGPGSADVITTDLTPEYVIFNGERS
jgi:glutamate N-acetyltransferase / amino-acid N-acetyltransferase